MIKIGIGITLIILGLISIFLFDKDITYFLYVHRDSFRAFNSLLKIVSTIGHYNVVFYISSFLILLSIFFKSLRKYVFILSLCLVLSDSAIMLFKFIFGKARPELFLKKGIYGFYFFKSQKDYSSIPSGHTLLNSSIAFSFYLKNKKLGFYLILWSTLVGISRILLFMHYLGDVLVSFGMGYLIAILVVKLEKLYLSSL
ncbi:MAG: phosphatase PAP2 family protein [Hydrogenobaculum sp.]